MKFRFLFILLIIPAVLFSQKNKKIDKEKDEENPFPRLELGLTFGMYFANKYNANYYNGQPGNVNSVGYLFQSSYPYNQTYEAIMEELGAEDEILLKDLPSDMHYNVALTGGLFLRYNITRTDGIFLEGNYVKLKADDVFTVLVDPQQYTFENIVLCGIHGVEERININLGYHRKFPVYKNKMNIFLQAGLNTNYVKVLETFVNFGDLEYSLVNTYGSGGVYINPDDLLQEQAGFGFGFIGGGGVGFTFTPTVGLEAGGNLIYTKVNLQGYDDPKPSGTAYIRLMITGLLKGEEGE